MGKYGVGDTVTFNWVPNSSMQIFPSTKLKAQSCQGMIVDVAYTEDGKVRYTIAIRLGSLNYEIKCVTETDILRQTGVTDVFAKGNELSGKERVQYELAKKKYVNTNRQLMRHRRAKAMQTALMVYETNVAKQAEIKDWQDDEDDRIKDLVQRKRM